MTAKSLLLIILVDLLGPLAVIFNIYLYFYPALYDCYFPKPPGKGARADFRLLTLADPQIEGDSAFYRYLPRAPRVVPDGESLSLQDRYDDVVEDIYRFLRRTQKTIDLWGNDLYLAHVYKVVKRGAKPTHVTVLGDLLGSQWISDEEFYRRSDRFWKIISDGTKVTAEDIAAGSADGDWRNKIINIAGNHDIGYGGDMTRGRIERFEESFGPVNYMLAFHPTLNETFAEKKLAPELRIAVLNSLTLDTPTLDQKLQDESYALVDKVLKNKSLSSTQATVLLTHLPFYKPAGVCVDAPEMEYFPEANGGGVKTQNMLSETVSELLRGWVYGLPAGGETAEKVKRRGVIMTGHDHEGCDVMHWWDERGDDQNPFGKWDVTRWKEWNETKEHEGVREVTVRSMMGDFGGNVGMLSGWFDWDSEEWNFGYSFCSLGVPHLWWATNIINAICIGLASVVISLHLTDMVVGDSKENEKKAQAERVKKAQ